MLSGDATLISVISAAAAIAGVLAYMYGLRRAGHAEARDEALALAETRGQMVAELRRRLTAVEQPHAEALARYEKRVRELEECIERTRRDAREQAYQVQRLYVLGLAELLAHLRDELEQSPPNVERALAHIRELLPNEELRSITR